MAGGRPPKPTELKRALGNPGKRSLPPTLAVLPSGGAPPVLPKGLGTLGRRAWRSYWTLGSTWLSQKTDLQILMRLCRAYDEEQALRKLVDQHGHLAENRFGDLVANPAVTQLRKLEELITRYEGLCGFTPSDRSRLGMAEITRESKLDQLISSRNQRHAAAGE
jgi:P27 family predicted phage terminase small subunit